MFKLLITILFLITAQMSFAQGTVKLRKDSLKIVATPAIEATFPSGVKALKKFMLNS